MALDPDRFLDAQAPVFETALAELRTGRKRSHWMWFVFPQLAGLGQSDASRYYAIGSLDDARAYLAHPVLGARLRQAARAVETVAGRSAEEILGPIDARKLRSSMTLFLRAEPSEALFRDVLDRLFGGRTDDETDRLLRSPASRSLPG